MPPEPMEPGGTPTVLANGGPDVALERIGDFVGPFKLLSVIGEGGFGTVWLAERREPFVQRVALKIIKPGMDSKAVIARFEQERQALAVMDHPNIAKVLDGGITPLGRPYFIMEHVKGEAITEFCDRHRMTIRQRLELFIPVCEAVQHAHMKGIIHRDIKPSNILVSMLDTGTAEPGGAAGGGTVHSGVVNGALVKVIDFGVAKAISQTLTEKTVFTEQGQIIGTPEYMSPEQAEMGAVDIDTRADVYSLGVVLYEMLTGALPFDPSTLRSKGYNEIQRIIREEEPPKPTTRLTSMPQQRVEDIARARHSDGRSLVRELRRELDWIPMMAMRKDRRERYTTAADLGADVRRAVAGEALVAAPYSLGYQLRKMLWTHRLAGAVALAVLSVLLFAFALLAASERRRLDVTNGQFLAYAYAGEALVGVVHRFREAAANPPSDYGSAMNDPRLAECVRAYRVLFGDLSFDNHVAGRGGAKWLSEERASVTPVATLSDDQVVLAVLHMPEHERDAGVEWPDVAGRTPREQARSILMAWDGGMWSERFSHLSDRVCELADMYITAKRPTVLLDNEADGKGIDFLIAFPDHDAGRLLTNKLDKLDPDGRPHTAWSWRMDRRIALKPELSAIALAAASLEAEVFPTIDYQRSLRIWRPAFASAMAALIIAAALVSQRRWIGKLSFPFLFYGAFASSLSLWLFLRFPPYLSAWTVVPHFVCAAGVLLVAGASWSIYRRAPLWIAGIGIAAGTAIGLAYSERFLHSEIPYFLYRITLG